MKRIVEIFDSSEEDNVDELPNEQYLLHDNNVRMEDAPGNGDGNDNNQHPILPQSNMPEGGAVNGTNSGNATNSNDNKDNLLSAMPNTNGSALSLHAQNNQAATGMNSIGSKPRQKVDAFRCSVCSKWYTYRGSLVRHFKGKHKEQMM